MWWIGSFCGLQGMSIFSSSVRLTGTQLYLVQRGYFEGEEQSTQGAVPIYYKESLEQWSNYVL